MRASTSRLSRITAAALTLGTASLMTACGPVEISSPDLAGAELSACQDFVAALPATLADQASVEVTPDDALGRAWGDPAIVVTCGVAEPSEFDEYSSCEQAEGVGWFVPDDQIGDQDLDVTATTVGYRPRVELKIPSDLRPDAVPAALADLAPLVKEQLELVQPCL